MLNKADSYEALMRDFRWEIPARFNIAVSICERWARAEPDRLALVHEAADGSVEHISFAELDRRASRLANVLAARGIKRGNRVALLMPQRPEVPIGHIAVYKLGAVVVPMAVLFGVDALQYRLENSGARALITDHGSLPKIAEIRDRLPDLAHVFSADGAESGVDDLAAETARASDTFETADTSAEDPAFMVYTSGTTGPPKGALHGHRTMLGHLPGVQFCHDFLPQDGDVMWTPSDWAWAGGLGNILLPSLHFGLPLVAHAYAKFDPEHAFALMARHRIRNAFIAPTALKLMRTVPEPQARYDITLRTIFSGGEAVGRELHEWTQSSFQLPINEVYGQSECNLVLGSCAALDVMRPGAIGKPIPGHEVAVIGADGAVLEPGESGIIAVKRPDPVMFLGYWQKEEATRDKFIGDWMTTGDQGAMDEDGYFHFVGRDDDVITSAGYRIGPGEIEDCLIAHPAVAMAAVVGKPDPVRTEIVKAFIVLKDGITASDALSEEISTHVRKRLSAHEYPREIAFKDALPMTTTGKIIRRLLREEA